MSFKGALAGGLAAVALVVGLAGVSQAASASTDGMPDGTWRQSCRQAYVENGSLRAQCRRANGQYVSASAPVGSCRAFGNRDGVLSCESSAGSSGSVGQWSGSFRNSCRDISVDKHGKLDANCRKSNGTYKHSNLQAHKCPTYRAGNRDGNLFCESGKDQGQIVKQWGGSFKQSCRDVSMDSSGSLAATCQAANGSWRRTSLSTRQCNNRRAGNRDGTLVCESGEGSGQNVAQWDGSFSQSCRDVSVDSSGSLMATCQAVNGSWRRTSLSTRQCNGRRAGNRDGTLFCET